MKAQHTNTWRGSKSNTERGFIVRKAYAHFLSQTHTALVVLTAQVLILPPQKDRAPFWAGKQTPLKVDYVKLKSVSDGVHTSRMNYMVWFMEKEETVVTPRSKRSEAELHSPDTRGHAADFSVSSTIRFSSLYCGLPSPTPWKHWLQRQPGVVRILKIPQSWQAGPASLPTTDPRGSPRCPEIPVTHRDCTTCPWSRSQSASAYRRTWKPATGKAESLAQHWNIRRGLSLLIFIFGCTMRHEGS